MKKKILIVYTEMILGGATTSLLSLLNAFDYSKYDVDLLLYEKGGILEKYIPENVNILEQAKTHTKSAKNLIIKGLYPPYILGAVRAYYHFRIKKNRLSPIQIMSRYGSHFSRKIDKEYDVSISYLEFWPLNYNALYVKAKKKIAWIHIDYLQSGLLPQFDIKAFDKNDAIILVSQQCLDNFKLLCPQCADKAYYIANLMMKENVVKTSLREENPLEETKEGDLKIISVCRISFSHKGLDRGIEAFRILKAEGLLENIKWYIIGDGEDMTILQKTIIDYDLEDKVVIMGAMINPLPYVRQCDMFFLPSRYEGKPMAVTEAQMLGLPPIVTEYSSAHEQIKDHYDGIIVENSTRGIIKGLREVLNDRSIIAELKKNVEATDYGNIEELKKIEKIIDGEL